MQLLNIAVVCFLTGYVNAGYGIIEAVVVTVDDLCSLPVVVGPCRAAFPRWFYNSTSQRCESFTYGGCEGNANRFETRELCESACQCDRCTLQRDPGPCRESIPSYFYNVTSEACEEFTYGGCQGNDNRFSSEDDCISQCAGNVPTTSVSSTTTSSPSPVPTTSVSSTTTAPSPSSSRALPTTSIPSTTSAPTLSPSPTQICSIEGQIYMSCGTACPLTCTNPEPVTCTRECVAGCQCPKETVLDEDNMRCVRPQFCPRPNETCDICSLQPETGLCEAYFPSYYWNVETRQCEQFIYGGCGGNLNRFSDIESCRNQCACASVNCPKGSQCKVYQPTGEPFCEGSCDLDNGGCADNETCSLKNVTCVRAPCPPVVECQSSNQCLQPKERGLCRARQRRFYYNKESGKCELFIYGGCGGNENRFSSRKECEKACKQACDIKGQKFTSCGTACPPTCSNPNPRICTLQCVIGCQCPQGTVLDEEQNECVRPNQCRSNMACDIEGQKFTSCGSACPPTCSNPNPICTRQCAPGCQCPRGTVLDEVQNKCVRLNQCKCPPTCSHEYCSVRSNRRKPCSRPPPHTIPACPDQCRTTQCNACYYSMSSLETPSSCDRRACTGRRFTRCLRNWASCVERTNSRRNRCRGDCIADDNFQCYDYPPCDNMRG